MGLGVKALTILTLLLLLAAGCGSCLNAALFVQSMVSTDPIYRSTPSSMNIWGPVQPEEKKP